MRVYLVKYHVYEDIYGRLMDQGSLRGSVVFADRERALEFAKGEIGDWLRDSKPRPGHIWGGITITERDTEDDALKIEWWYDHSGRLKERLVFDENECGYDIRPGDELPQAGTRFKKGDIVELMGGCPGNVYVVAGTPLKPEPPRLWENIYAVACIEECGGYWCHGHVHESEMKKYSGELPDGYDILSKLYKDEFRISLRRLKEIFGEHLTGNGAAQAVIKRRGLSDDSTDTGELLLCMLQSGALDIRGSVTSWRKAEKIYDSAEG
ncbi:MAG: hypothetical protein J1F63_06685 [Oscillospiraceae bacterium]|nr:hypothetical protein [Oscillospiraceae bacterium]